jgi:hypothetical protein
MASSAADGQLRGDCHPISRRTASGTRLEKPVGTNYGGNLGPKCNDAAPSSIASLPWWHRP